MLVSLLLLVYTLVLFAYQGTAFNKINAHTSLSRKSALKWKTLATFSAITWPITGPIELGLILHRKYTK